MVESLISEEQKERKMESRSFSLVFIGPPTSGKSTFTTYVSETLHLPILHASRIIDPKDLPTDGSLISDDVFNETLKTRLLLEPPTGHIFDGIPRTPEQARVVAEWSKQQGFPLHIIDLEVSDDEVVDRIQNREVCPNCQESYHFKIKPSLNPDKCDADDVPLIKRPDDNEDIIRRRLTDFHREKQAILEVFQTAGFQIHTIDSNGLIQETARRVFKELSPLSFDDSELANKYFDFKDLCADKGIDFMLISGACGYIYRGRRPLKDLDVLVPSLSDLQQIAISIQEQVEFIDSSYATSQYLNYSAGLEPVTDLSIKYKEAGGVKAVPFRLADLSGEAVTVRFFGEACKIMSPEWLVVFKLCMGRSGKDDFGHNKNDYADAYDVAISQPLDYERISQIAKQIGAENRVREGLEILKSSAY